MTAEQFDSTDWTKLLTIVQQQKHNIVGIDKPGRKVLVYRSDDGKVEYWVSHEYIKFERTQFQ